MQEINEYTNPFPGLRPFESTETHLFFGRDGQSEELLKRLKRTQFLAVVGTSGSGKSSLVRAGLLPALQGGLMAGAGSDWRIAVIRPGNDPIGNLARALMAPGVLGSGDEKNADIQTAIAETTLRRSSLGLVEVVGQARMALDHKGRPLFPKHENLLLVVDQFEELFRFKRLIENESSREDAAAFVKLLLEALQQRDGKIYVVLTMRSDYLGDCSQFWDLPEAINNGQYLIPRMTRDERREAIAGPVAVGQGAITEPLINQLLNDVGDSPDQLPILQHALMRTWDYWTSHRRNGEPIDIDHYKAIGGMADALSRHADEAYGELTEAGKEITEKLFKGLTEKGPDNREVRQTIELKDICDVVQADEADVVAVIEAFRRPGRSFLMPPADVPLTPHSLIDISHESLIRNWERLKGWVDEEAQSARTYRRLAETAVLYEEGKEVLLKDPALQLTLDWRENSKPNKAWASRYHPEYDAAMSFLDKSIAAREAELLERERQLKREVSYKRSRWLLAILALAFIPTLAALAYAFGQQREASRQRIIAEQQTQEALKQKEIAEQKSQEAFQQKGIAEQNAQEALKQKGIAEEQSAKAKEAEQVALNQKKEAEKARLQAIEQARKASENEKQANIARASAEEEREKAKAVGEESRQLLYAADINLAQQAIEAGNFLRARDLLNEIAGQSDLRGYEWYYLWRLSLVDKAILQGHESSIISVAFSPDGRTLATGSTDNTVKLWDIASRRELATLKGHTSSIISVAFSPDGKMLATSSDGNTVKLWDIASHRELATLAGHISSIISVAFSPDGRTLATGSTDNTVKLWDIASHRELATLTGHISSVYSVAFSPDGRTLATGSADNTVKLWDIASHRELATLTGHASFVNSVAFSPDGRTLATGSTDNTVKLWDIASHRELATLAGHISSIISVAFSPDGKTLATGSADKAVKLWDIASHRELATLTGHTDSVNSVAFSPDGRTLATGSADNTVKLWDIVKTRAATLKGHKSYIYSVAFSPDDKTLATGSADNTVKLWDIASHRELATLTGHTDSVNSVAFSPDGRTLATGSDDRTVKLWDIASHRELATLKGYESSIISVAFSPDGKTLATGSTDNTVKLWDIASRRELATLTGHTDSVNSVAFSPDGRTLATGSDDRTVKLWDIASHRELATLAGHISSIISVAFSPDGRTLATGSTDNTVKLWDIASRRELATLKGHTSSVYSVAFSPDGRTLATGSADNTVKLWDIALRRELATLTGHASFVNSVAFSPDGRTLATGSADNTVKLWYAATDEEVAAQRK